MNALSARAVSKRFGGVVALDAVSLMVDQGERHLIIGPNGAGKTTLFNLFSGVFSVTAGSIHMFDKNITELPANKRALLGIGRTFQITQLFLELSVVENVLLALQSPEQASYSMFARLKGDKPLLDRAFHLLEQWALSPIASHLVRDISYGQKRQVDIILAIARHPMILLLDEPMAGLSAAETLRVVGMIKDLPKSITVLMIEHDMDVAFALADQITVMNQGRVIAQGDVGTIRALPEVSEIYLGAEENA